MLKLNGRIYTKFLVQYLGHRSIRERREERRGEEERRETQVTFSMFLYLESETTIF